MTGRTTALFAESGAGKTTQAGEAAKDKFKRERKRTIYCGMDMGGYDSLLPLVDLGIIEPVEYRPDQGDDPWEYLDAAVAGEHLKEDSGLIVFDSATSAGEALLSYCAKQGAKGIKIGTQPAPKLSVGTGLVVGANTESHYGLVQTFLLDTIWKSTWLSRRGVDVLWTFAVHRGESATDAPILGPKMAGKALTAQIPKWFKYTFFIDVKPSPDGPPRHVLYTQPAAQLNGMGFSFANPRYPLDASTPLPLEIEPASLSAAYGLIEAGHAEAKSSLETELGL